MLAVLNLTSNSIYSDGGKELLEAVKANTVLEHVILRYNSINNHIVTEIDEKTADNLANVRRKKVPVYQQEIRAMVVDEDMIDEIEWRTEQCRQQRQVVEREVERQAGVFEELKQGEMSKYRVVKIVHDQVSEEGRRLDARMGELRDSIEGIKADSEKTISLIMKRMNTVRNRISQLEIDGTFTHGLFWG